MMAELCCVATLRQLPQPHPLHQVSDYPPSLLFKLCPNSYLSYFFTIYLVVSFWTVVDATRPDFAADQPTSSGLNAGCWWRL